MSGLMAGGGLASARAQTIATEPFDYTETRWTNDVPGFYDGGTGWGTNTWQVDLTQQVGHPVPQVAIFGTNDYETYDPQTAYAWGHGGRLYRDLENTLASSPGTKVYFCLDMYTPEIANSHVSGTLGGFGVSIESQAAKPGELITYTPVNNTWNIPKPVELTGLYGKWHRMTAEIEFFATGSTMRAWIDASRETDPHEVISSTCTAFTASRFYIAHWGDSGYALADNLIIGTNFSQVALPLAVLGTNGVIITSGEAATAAKGTRFPSLLLNYAYTNVFSITNSGSEHIALTAWATNGTDAALFAAHELPSGIGPGSVSNFSVVFHPTNAGSFTASLSFSNDSAVASRIVNLAGVCAETFVVPSNGPYAGDYPVSVWHGYGSVFTNVIVGAAAGVAPTEAAADHVNFVMPRAVVAGPMNITLQRAGDTEVTLTNAFTYDAAWFVVSPSNGPYAGGTAVTVSHGLNSTVTNVVVRGMDVPTTGADTNGFSLVMPAVEYAGWVDFTMQRADADDFILTNAFQYNAAMISVSPNSGRLSGGDVVTVTHDLNGVVTNVLVDGMAVVPDSASTTNFILTMPAASVAGAVNFVLQRNGVGDFTIVNAYTYNPAGFIGYTDPDSWSAVPGLPEARFQHAAATLSNRIYVIGGYDADSAPRDTVYAFDGTNWIVETALPGSMTDIGATSDGSNIWLAGNGADALMQYNGASWATVANLTDARMWPLMTVFSNRPVVVSGGVGAVTEWDGSSLNEWAAIPDGNDLVGGAGGVLGDFLFAAGGGYGVGSVTNAWSYDGSAWSAVAGLPAARSYMATAVWRDQIYAMGGLDVGYAAESTVYRFDGTNWSSGGALPYHINAAAAAVLNDALYHIGGMSTELGALTNVYKYVLGEEYTGVSPACGNLTGGFPVTIRGINLGNGSDVTNVTICGVAAQSIVSQSATQIVVLAGAASVMTNGDVVVYSTSYSETVRSNAFTYIYLSSWRGPYAGGNIVTLTNLVALGDGSDITNVLVGGIAATLEGQGTDWVRFILGAATNAGYVDIVVQSGSVGETIFTESYTYNPPGVIGWRDPDGAWAETVSLPYRVIRAPLVTYSNGLYVIGGRQSFSSGTIYNNVSRFDGTNWTAVAVLPVAAMNLGAAVWDGAIYATGNNTTNVYRFDGSAWSEVAGLPAARRNPMVCVFSNRLHVLCGGSYSNVFVYDGTNWSETTGLPDQHLREYVPGGVHGDYLYVSSCNTPGYTEAWRFNGTEWTTAPGMDVVRYWVGAAATADRLYAVGGAKNGAFCNDTVYFDGTNWIAGSSLPYNQYLGGASEFNGALYAIGGARSNVLRMALGDAHYGVSPTSDALTGGYEVVIGGLNLCDPSDPLDLTNVTLCGVSAAIQPGWSATQIVVVAGASGAAGFGDVRVYSVSFGETVKSHAFEYHKGNQTIMFSPIGAQSANAAVGLSATASSGLPVIFTTNGGPGVITGGTNLTFTGVGVVSILASQAGDINWNPAPEVTNTIHVYALSTNVGPYAGGNTITITTGSFGTITNVLVGGVAASIQASGSDWVSIIVPATGSDGTKDILIQTDSGDSVLADAYTVNPMGQIIHWGPGFVWTNMGSGANDSIWGLACDGTNVYAGGFFTQIGGMPANRVAMWNGESWTNLDSGINEAVFTLCHDGVNLYAGGSFTSAGGRPASRIAMWNGVCWTNLGSGVNGTVENLAHDGVNLYVGGQFTMAGGTSANRVAMWNGESWTNMGSGMNLSVGCLVCAGADVFAAGPFTLAGGVYVTGLARWDGAAWNAVGDIAGRIHSLAHDGTNLYVGGRFTSAGGVPASCVTKWDGASWTNLDTGIQTNVDALCVDGVNLYAGGIFTNAGELPVNRIAMWDGTHWTNMGSGMNNSVAEFCRYTTNLYAGGVFTVAGGLTANHIAMGHKESVEESGVMPSVGSYTGGYAVIILGSNLCNGTDVTNVTLCGLRVASVISQSSTQIVVVAAASGDHGVGDVRVYSTSYGETVKSNAFAYVASGILVSGPAFDPISLGGSVTNLFTVTNAGNAVLTIAAATNNGAGAAYFNVSAIPTSVQPGTASNFPVVFAPGEPGTFNPVCYTVNDSPYPNYSFGLYGRAFQLSTNVGPYAGGNTITITNGNFGGITNVLVGGVQATIQDTGANWVRITIPAASSAGVKNIVIQTAAGGTSLVGAYTYNPVGLIGRFALMSAHPIAGGGYHSLGVKSEGWIAAWGANYSGQANVPATNANFLAVAAGLSHSLGLKSDGTIMAWGENIDGQTDVPAPNTNFTAVAGGAYHSLGLKSDSTIMAWGRNFQGQTTVPEPNTNFVAVAGGTYHSLGLKSDSTIVAWGANFQGQLDIPAPNTNFVAIAAGSYHSLGLKADGSVVGCGMSVHGELDVPAPNTNFVAVAAGNWHSLGLKADGTIVAWGDNGSGQLNVPAPNTNFVAVAAGIAHSLGLKADGTIVAWGLNVDGQANVPAPNADFGGWGGGVSPSSGSWTGGYPVVVSGQNLCNGADVTNVTLCGVAVQSITSQSATQIVVVADGGDVGLGDVRVYSTSYGETVRSNAFTYNGPGLQVVCSKGFVVTNGAPPWAFADTRFLPTRLGLSWTNTFGITNNGTEDVTISGFGISDASFVISNLPSSVAVGGASNFTVSYIPTSVGDHSAALSISNDSPAAVYVMNFAGSCFAPSTSSGPLAGGNTLTVSNGYFGTVTNVIVFVGEEESYSQVIPIASGSNWFTIIMPPATNAGTAHMYVQTSDNWDIPLFYAYTYNPAGQIGGKTYGPCAWTNLGSGVNDVVYALTHDGTNPYAGGWFDEAGGVSASCIAKWDTTLGAWTNLGSGLSTRPEALVYDGTDLYAGGWFGEAGGVSASRVAKWDSVSGTWTNLGSGVNSPVYALAHDGTNLYAGGTFTNAGGVSANYVAMWDTASGVWTNLGSGVNGSVIVLLHNGANLYAGGTFTTAGGVSANRIAKWDAASGTWTNLGSGMDSAVFALAHDGTNLYAGGFFTNAGGVSANYVAKWDSASGTWTNLGRGMNDWVVALTHDGTNLYAGGSFTNAGDAAGNFVAMWNGTSWTNLGSGMDFSVDALAHDGMNLYAGGEFLTAGGVTVNRVAKWGPGINEFGGVSPVSGSWTGHYPVAISGLNLGNGADITNVTLCGVAATISSQTADRVWVIAGTAQAAALGDIIVQSVSFGETIKSSAFEYLKTDQSITDFLPTNGSVFVENETVGLSATASSGLTVLFTNIAGPGVVTGTNLSFTSGGLVSVVAQQPGNSNWNPAVEVTNLYRVLNLVTLTVDSEHGSPNPAVGVYINIEDQVLTNSVATYAEQNRTQYVCIGWTGTGNVPVSGTTNVVSYTITNDSSITWQWNTNVYFSATGGVHGTTGGDANGWYALGGSVTVTATAGENYHFTGWEGDVPGADTNNNPLTLTLDHARNVTALFYPNAPMIACTPTNLVFTGQVFGAIAPKLLIVSNAAGMVLNYSIESDAYWLKVSATTGTAPEGVYVEHTVSIPSRVIPQGTYQGTLTVTDTNALNDPYVVPVELNMTYLYPFPSAVRAWGQNTYGQSSPPAGLTNVVMISAGHLHALALRDNGTVVAWGWNNYGQTNVPATLSNVVMISGGGYHSMALEQDGLITVWGRNTQGQRTPPAGLSNVIYIAAGGYHSLAVRDNGTVAAWGDNTYGQITVPTALSNVVAVSGGNYYSLALRENGKVVAWGQGTYGQTNVPASLSNVVAISAGGYHVLALRENGTIVTWGANGDGQRNVPAGATNIVNISANGNHSMALRADGRVFAWGDNDDGESTVPSDVRYAVMVSAGWWNSLALTPATVSLIVNTPLGTPSPARGTNWYPRDASVEALAETVVNGTTQYACYGWTGTGAVPATGETNTVALTLTTNSSITWLWLTNYWLNSEAGTHGTVNVGDGWKQAGITTQITATADTYYHFTNWTGSTTSLMNPLDLLMNGSKVVMANFAENMTTSAPAPVPEVWMAQYGLTNFEQEVNDDPDGDGQKTWEEYIASESDPTNPLSYFHTEAGLGSMLISWPSAEGRVYDVQQTHLVEGYEWTAITVWTNLAATPPMNVVTNPSAVMTNAAQFFRAVGRME